MKCFIKTTQVPGKAEFSADVVSEQDYHERGPSAHSYRSQPHGTPGGANAEAREWAEENGYRIYSVDEIAA